MDNFVVVYWAVFLFLVGPVIASYISLIVSRQHKDFIVTVDRNSQCETCGKQLSWYELIPIISFLVQRGRCSSCHSPIDVRIFLSELIGLAALSPISIYLLVNLLQLNLDLPQILNLTALTFLQIWLIYLSINDIYTYSVPARPVYLVNTGLFILTIISNIARLFWLQGSNTGISFVLSTPSSLAGGLILWFMIAALILATKQRAMGWGDVWIAMTIGIVWGIERALVVIYFSVIAGGIIGLIYALRKGRFKGLLIPFVPCLLLGSSLTIIYGETIISIFTR